MSESLESEIRNTRFMHKNLHSGGFTQVFSVIYMLMLLLLFSYASSEEHSRQKQNWQPAAAVVKQRPVAWNDLRLLFNSTTERGHFGRLAAKQKKI